jgi:hypothetical protein
MNEDKPIWEYVSIADYQRPSTPVTQTAKKGLTFFQDFLQRDEPDEEGPLKKADELRRLSDWQIEEIVPAPDWAGAAEALAAHLEEWLASENSDQSAIVLVGPPYSGLTEIVPSWAEQQGWPLIEPPSAEQILAEDYTWFTGQRSNGEPWVLPSLERTYLRHANGLNLIRRFMDEASSGSLGRGLIRCDSWAWSFLHHIWNGRRPMTLTLQAWDQPRLSKQLQKLADSTGGQQCTFRQADDGRYVLPSLSDEEQTTEDPSDFLQLLAAYSRGIWGIAWEIWRNSLRTEPDVDLEEELEEDEDQDLQHTIWVTPWDQMEQPDLSSEAERDDAFVLHTLLLHNGLSLQTLQQLLFLSPTQVTETVFRLEKSGMVILNNTTWQVAPQGYPAVRDFLQKRGYLIDQF